MADANCSACATTNDSCKCPNNCVRHGKCDECQANHAKNNSLTHCQRERAKESK